MELLRLLEDILTYWAEKTAIDVEFSIFREPLDGQTCKKQAKIQKEEKRMFSSAYF